MTSLIPLYRPLFRAALHLGRVVLVASALFGLGGCNRSSGTPTGDTTSTSGPQSGEKAGKKAYTTKGSIKAFGEGRKTVKIAHEEIPGYMKAMTMPFAVSAPTALDGLSEGDAVDFSFTEESDGRMLIQSIKKK